MARSEGYIAAELFLTDDGCIDGTSEAVHNQCAAFNLPCSIISGDGNLFWAGGMRLTWQKAIESGEEWDYYLLINDDTIVQTDAFDTLLSAQQYCLNTYGSRGIVSGITSAFGKTAEITYGGEIFTNRFTGRRRLLSPTGTPQLCDWAHANALLVPSEVVKKQGILYKGYRHGQADLDYSYRARRSGIPVVVTAKICGFCDFDHPNIGGIRQKLCGMTLKERRAYLNHPLHSDADYLTMTRRCMPIKYPLTWFFRKLNLYTPFFYYWLNNRR
jgi:GT2 family glycosyltransferase